MKITDIHNPWRDALAPASFRGARFHCETNARESGRRIVQHQFPKKNLPYAEDMGREAIGFSVRGYCISFPSTVDGNEGILFNRDYRIARNLLRNELEEEGPGLLQLPTQPGVWVVCQRYRLTEEERMGGYCVFDMMFTEVGINPNSPASVMDTKGAISKAADAMQESAKNNLDNDAGSQSIRPPPGLETGPIGDVPPPTDGGTPA
jgi:prophage DNA circulation protein